MKDRVPTYPGRVKLTPVSGQTNTYDMERADSPTVEGSALNKANILPDDVCENLGLDTETAELKDALNALVDSILPSGCILLWSGSTSTIPSGWYLCNGSNGTPDLRNRFVVGAGSSYSVGATGGAASVTLTVAQIPAHTHTIDINTTGAIGSSTPYGMDQITSKNTSSFTSNSTGSGSAHENRPPYYALCYIMKA